tara:strand:- start:1065 stop:1394 length:330 start_codon:yes stop_codon:yes gene_type:complete
MAARSTGMFPREGFNLDAECEITSSSAAAKTTLANAKTIRVIGIGVATDITTVSLGGVDVVLDPADADPNGVVIAHVRGALCTANNNVSYTATGTVSGVFYELVDGPRR